MSNPILTEVLRGGIVESRHRGSISVFDGQGRSVISVGEVSKPVFPRSACKLIQALPFVESGAAEAYGFGNKELSLVCASHSGEPEHVALAEAMLIKAGQNMTTLECGTHWPFDLPVAIKLAQSGALPTACHNNCSGKHAGFICTAAYLGEDPTGYVGPSHAAQMRVRDAMAEVTGAIHTSEACGTDGCSIPTYAISLSSLALGFAKAASGYGLSTSRAKAAKKLMDACMAEPFYMAGTKRFCTEIMAAAPNRVFAKIGAEGVYCAAIPELGFGIALKIDDGAFRAAELTVAATIAHLAKALPDIAEPVSAMARKVDRNWNKMNVGEQRVVASVFG